MLFDTSDKAKDLQEKLKAFMDKYIYPNESEYFRQLDEGDRWKVIPLIEELKAKAKSEGLWNLFLPESEYGAGLTNYEYAPMCEIMGRVFWSSEVFNCSAPDTGNMEVLERYGTREQKERWLTPLLAAMVSVVVRQRPSAKRNRFPPSRYKGGRCRGESIVRRVTAATP